MSHLGKNWFQSNSHYLLPAVMLLLLAILAAAVFLNPGDSTPPKTSTKKPGGGVVQLKRTGLHNGRYYAQTFSFKVSQDMKDLALVSSGDAHEQATFTFEHGQGAVISSPQTGTYPKRTLGDSYQGQRQAIRLAGSKGYVFRSRQNSSQIWNIIGLSGQQNFAIQLSQSGDGSQINQIGNKIISTLRARN